VDCKRFEVAVHEYCRETLSAEERLAVERHAGTCAACGELLARCGELSCRELVEFLGRYLDGELDAVRRELFERHMEICPDCTAYVDSYEKSMRLGALALGPRPLTDAPLPEELVRAILAARKRS
jgi:anti-sigma factor RsiW